MRTWIWAIAAGLGFGLMCFAYSSRAHPDPGTPWAYGLIAIGPEGSTQEKPPGQVVPTRLRFVHGNERVEIILRILGEKAPGGALALRAQLRPKLILLPAGGASIGDGALQSGRLPGADGSEILAGSTAPAVDRLAVGDRVLKVVGVLKPDVALFADCYLVPGSESAGSLFPAAEPSVQHAALVRLTAEQCRDRQVLAQLEATYPAAKFAKLMPSDRLGRGPYYTYLVGQAILLVCGSGALFGLYRWLADRVRFGWLAAPLQELKRRPRLVWAVHLTYFGLVMLSSILIYELPEVQAVFMSSVRSQIGGSSGVMSVAGRAYSSGSIPRAATVTFLINFLIGSIAVITLPSVVVPGAGTLMATIRAVAWGLLLGPTSAMMAFAMLPHSGTMLLEGEGYILAALFAFLIPVHLAQSNLGGTALGRYGGALLLNLQANAWVAMVLAVAACYEAVEVIWMAR